MKRKALKFGTVGFLFGCFAYLLFSIVVSLRMNTWDFYFALPALENNYSNELFATIAQIVTFTWLGLACGIACLFSENVELEPVKQGVGYLVSLTVGIIQLIMISTKWVLCPVCGNKTRNKIREDTELKNFPLYCPKCKQESLIEAKNLHITIIKEPDALDAEPMN